MLPCPDALKDELDLSRFEDRLIFRVRASQYFRLTGTGFIRQTAGVTDKVARTVAIAVITDQWVTDHRVVPQ